jgi:hypothetical protein
MLQYLWGVAKIYTTLLVHDFLYFFCNSYELAKFTEVATSQPLYAKKFVKLLLFFRIASVFWLFEHSFEPQDDSF